MFFFSSRRRHTRCSRDWSSDVCSSDLSTRRNRLPINRKKNNSAAMLYPSLECFCTVVGSSSSSSCFSQQKHRKEIHRAVAQKRQERQHHPPPRPVSRHRKFQNCQHHRKEAKHPEPHGLMDSSGYCPRSEGHGEATNSRRRFWTSLYNSGQAILRCALWTWLLPSGNGSL